MSGLGGLNKSPDGVVIGLVQLQLPNVVTPDDLATQCDRICTMLAKARRNLPTMDTDGTFWGFPAPTRTYKGEEIPMSDGVSSVHGG